MKWQSNDWFCFVQIDQTYQPGPRRRSLPPCGPFVATSSIATNIKVSTTFIVQCTEKEPLATSGRQLRHIDEAIHTMTSSSEELQWWLVGRTGPNCGSISQLMMLTDGFGSEMTGKTGFKQRRERGFQWGLCGYSNHSCRTASSRHRGNDYATAWTYLEMMNTYDRQPQSLKHHSRRVWMLMESGWGILQGPKMRTMGNSRMLMKKIHSLANWAKMMNSDGWCAQSPTQFSTAWRGFNRS